MDKDIIEILPNDKNENQEALEAKIVIDAVESGEISDSFIDLISKDLGIDKKMKKAWIENVVAQGERYYNLNYFFAWYYFNVKRPRSYVKAMATRQLNKKLTA